jgi:hypothetical protein
MTKAPGRAVARDPAHAPALISGAIPCAALLGVACVLAFVSGLFDGAYAAPLTPVQRTLQITLVTAHLAVGVVAGLRAASLLHR